MVDPGGDRKPLDFIEEGGDRAKPELWADDLDRYVQKATRRGLKGRNWPVG